MDINHSNNTLVFRSPRVKYLLFKCSLKYSPKECLNLIMEYYGDTIADKLYEFLLNGEYRINFIPEYGFRINKMRRKIAILIQHTNFEYKGLVGFDIKDYYTENSNNWCKFEDGIYCCSDCDGPCSCRKCEPYNKSIRVLIEPSEFICALSRKDLKTIYDARK